MCFPLEQFLRLIILRRHFGSSVSDTSRLISHGFVRSTPLFSMSRHHYEEPWPAFGYSGNYYHEPRQGPPTDWWESSATASGSWSSNADQSHEDKGWECCSGQWTQSPPLGQDPAPSWYSWEPEQGRQRQTEQIAATAASSTSQLQSPEWQAQPPPPPRGSSAVTRCGTTSEAIKFAYRVILALLQEG